jgi:hypothetical protein
METQGSPQDARVGAIPFAIFVVAGTRIGGGAGLRHGRSDCSFWGMFFLGGGESMDVECGHGLVW